MILGILGIQSDKISDIAAIPEATTNTYAGEYSQIYPSNAGRTTAPMWLIVKATAAVDEISAGSAIF